VIYENLRILIRRQFLNVNFDSDPEPVGQIRVSRYYDLAFMLPLGRSVEEEIGGQWIGRAGRNCQREQP